MIDWSKWGSAKQTQDRFLLGMEISGWLVVLVALTPYSAQAEYVLKRINYSLRLSIINKPVFPEWPSLWAVIPVVLLGLLWIAMAKKIRASIANEK